MNTNKQIKVWSIKMNLIHIVLTYTINECSRDVDLLKNKYILLLLLTHTKLQDWMTFNTLYKHNQSQKLIIENDNINVLNNCINHKKNSLLSKKNWEKHVSTLLKMKMSQKAFFVNW